MADKVTIEVEADVKGAIESLDEVKDGVKDVGKSAKAQVGATNKLAAGFKGVGLAMKAAGIGIVLALVSKLSEAMSNNQEIADTVSTAFNMIGIVMNKIIATFKTVFDRTTESGDNFDALGRIISNLMTLALTPLKTAFYGVGFAISQIQLAWEKSWLGAGDVEKIKSLTEQVEYFSSSLKKTAIDSLNATKNIVVDFKEGVGEIAKLGEVIVEEFDNTFKNVTVKSVYDQANAVTQATSNLSLLEAKHQRIIVQFEKDAEVQRAIRDDVSKSIKDRIKANDELLTISEKQAEAEIKALKEQQGALSQQLKIQVGNKEIQAQIYALETAIIETKKRAKSLDKESAEQRNILLAEELANKQELAKIGVDEAARQQQEFLNEKNRLLRIAELTITNKFLLAKKQIEIQQDYQKKKDALDKVELEKTKAIEDAKRQVITGALTGLTALVGAETKAGKAMAVASATIDTYVGATKALAQGGIFGTIAAVGVIASGLANVRAILQTDIPGETGGGDMPSTPEMVQDTIPTVPTFGAIGTEPPPVQAFVVESDVSSSQALQNDLNLQATL